MSRVSKSIIRTPSSNDLWPVDQSNDRQWYDHFKFRSLYSDPLLSFVIPVILLMTVILTFDRISLKLVKMYDLHDRSLTSRSVNRKIVSDRSFKIQITLFGPFAILCDSRHRANDCDTDFNRASLKLIKVYDPSIERSSVVRSFEIQITLSSPLVILCDSRHLANECDTDFRSYKS